MVRNINANCKGRAMKYLKFDRANLTNLDESLQKEILCTNRRGAYYCSTILGCNTRKYHGMLVVPSSKQLDDRWVLLSSMDETVIQHGAEFNLAVHKYADGVFSPNGHKYLREFDVERAMCSTYRVGGVLLSKEFLFMQERNQLIVRYKLLDAHSATRLRLKPFLAFRKTNQLTYENAQIDWSYSEVANGISYALYQGVPRLYIQFSKAMSYEHSPHWNKHLYYDKDAECFHNCVEDLPVPGAFECEIGKGEELYLSVSDVPIDPATLRDDYVISEERIVPKDSFTNCLKGAADQFYVEPELGKSYLLSGFPWFGVCHRDQMIGLTAVSFGTGHGERYKLVMDNTIRAIWDYYERGITDEVIKGIEQPDALLWMVNCIQDYSRWVGMEKARNEYGSTVKKAVAYIRSNRMPLMHVMDNGLLYAIPENSDRPITWMDAIIDGHPVVDRQGYIVEYNALWYNALCFQRELLGDHSDVEDDFIERVSESFVRVFVNEYDYLFDCVVEDRKKDWAVRPNQILASGLTYSPLSRKLQRSILDIVTKELHTSKGLRSLSPVDGAYHGYCSGNDRERTYAYLNGGVWSWLIYFYLSASFKLFRSVGVSYIDRLLIPFEDELKGNCIGTISDVYDGTPPYLSRSAISYMMSVTAVLRIQNRLSEYYTYHMDGTLDLRLSLTSLHKSLLDDDGKGIVDNEI